MSFAVSLSQLSRRLTFAINTGKSLFAGEPTASTGLPCEANELACKPDSVIPKDRRPSIWDAHRCAPRCDLPADIGRAARQHRHSCRNRGCPLGLAPGGVYQAIGVTVDAGELLPHRFTLTRTPRREPLAVCFLWHCPARHRGWPLATTVLCGVRTFLDGFPPRPPGQLIRTNQSIDVRNPQGASSDTGSKTPLTKAAARWRNGDSRSTSFLTRLRRS